MKLYQTYVSPFPTRVRLALYAKGIAAEIVEPPGFHSDGRSKGDYLSINPMGRVPTLVLDDGRAIPESEVICEYLEDAWPLPALLPADPWNRARVRLISRICDTYLVMAMAPLFAAAGQSRRRWDRDAINRAARAVETALGYLESYVDVQGYAVGTGLSWADGALIPQLMLAYEWAPDVFETPNPLDRHPRLATYWRAIHRDPIAARLIGETREAVAKERATARAMAGSRAPS